MGGVTDDPYVTALRDHWGISWRMFIANRLIDTAVIVALFWLFGDPDTNDLKDGIPIMLGVVLGFGVYIAVRDWFASIAIGGGSGDDEYGYENLSILHALRRMKVTPDVISPARIDGLQYAVDSFTASQRDKMACALLFGIIKGRSAHMRSWQKLAFEDSVDRAILRYVRESSPSKDDPADE